MNLPKVPIDFESVSGRVLKACLGLDGTVVAAAAIQAAAAAVSKSPVTVAVVGWISVVAKNLACQRLLVLYR